MERSDTAVRQETAVLGSPTPDPSHGPGGLIVIMRTDPVAAARALAQEHGIEVTTGGAATAEAIARLTDLVDAGPSPDAATDPVAAVPAMAATRARRATDAELDDLAAGMRRADALRDRTRQQLADELCHSLNSSLTIHPDTLRRAAAELIDARQAVTLARDGRSPDAKQTRASQAGTVGAVGPSVLQPPRSASSSLGPLVWPWPAWERRAVWLANARSVAMPAYDYQDSKQPKPWPDDGGNGWPAAGPTRPTSKPSSVATTPTPTW